MPTTDVYENFCFRYTQTYYPQMSMKIFDFNLPEYVTRTCLLKYLILTHVGRGTTDTENERRTDGGGKRERERARKREGESAK